jgi:pimeloyl-ACP methyl ester carboxylesterase
LHGEIDGLINISHAERLRATSPRVELVKIRGGDHNNLQELPEYNAALSDRLAKL